MEEELNYLLQLCEFDKNIYQLKKSNKDLPRKIKSLQDENAGAEKRFNSVAAELAICEAKIKEARTFADEEKERLDSSNHRLENISTNKEYDAVHAEIAAHKKNIEDAQATALHYQQVLENIRSDKEKAEKEFQAILEQNSPELQKLTAELNSLESRIEEERKKSDIPRQKISKKTLSIYERILQRRQTPYIIATVNDKKRTCEICNRTQPAQKLNELSKMHSLQTCETCGSILIWREEEVAVI